MFFGIDLNQIFTFPFKDADSRKHFLIGSLVSLSAFIIPVLPFLVLYGYAVRIARQVLNDETPHMVEWDDWGGMLKDGAKLFGIRIIYSIPILILAIPLFVSMFIMPFFMSDMGNSQADVLIPIFIVIMLGAGCILIPFSLAITLIIPAAEMYMVDKDDFSAGFRIREWWAIFRANLSGFIAAFAIYYLSSMALAIVVQIIGATLILACLLPFLLPAVTLYITLIMYTTIAQAYKVGKEKLAQAEVEAAPVAAQ